LKDLLEYEPLQDRVVYTYRPTTYLNPVQDKIIVLTSDLHTTSVLHIKGKKVASPLEPVHPSAFQRLQPWAL
jgi:hypothetical protein